MKINKPWGIALSIMGCFLVVYVCTFIGITNIPFQEANRILFHHIFGGDMSGYDAGQVAILWDVRLPRVVLAFLCGGALGICGAVFQGVFKNPMADPYILGVSSGAAFGAAIGIVMHVNTGFLGVGSTAILALVGALVTIFMVYNISRVGRRVPVATLLLSGIAVGQTLSALMSLLMIFNLESMNKIMFWTMGSFNGSTWIEVGVLVPFVLVGLLGILTSLRELDILLLGEEAAMQLGVDTEKLKRKLLILSSVLTAVVVAMTGIIGFVGLVIPHMVRLVTGPKNRFLVPTAFIVGGGFLVVCDTLARSVLTSEIPVGIITAAFGGPFFIYLLKKQKRGA